MMLALNFSFAYICIGHMYYYSLVYITYIWQSLQKEIALHTRAPSVGQGRSVISEDLAVSRVNGTIVLL